MKKFTKNFLIIRNNNNNIVFNLKEGLFGLYFNKNYILTYNQYKAIIFFCKKKLKFYSKLFIRLNPKLKNTKKAIGIRMGKGKGNLNTFYFPVLKGQLFFEFGFKKKNKEFIFDIFNYNKLKKKIILLTKLVSKKLSIKLHYIKKKT